MRLSEAIRTQPMIRIKVSGAKGSPGSSGDTGAQGPAGDLAKAVGRSLLTGISGASGNMVRNLVEGGRSGLFTFVETDLSAMVAIDTRQAVYIAPDSDPTGASGAWVRQYNGDLRAEWFGLASDDATDDAPAINAALLLAKSLASSYTYIAGGPSVSLPANAKCYCASTITMQKGVGLVGGGRSLSERTQLRFAAGVSGISILATDSVGAGPNAQGSFVHGLKLKGAFLDGTNGEGEYHGIEAATAFDGRDLHIEGFQGDGIHLYANSSVDNSYSQQGNGFTFRNLFISGCRDGVLLQGGDSNAGIIDKASIVYSRRWGINDSSFLGNYVQAVHTDGCGSTTAYTGVPTCGVTHSAKRYSVVKGQEAGASTNAPSGTTADNTWWYYCFDGVSGNPAWPDWVSGITVRAGGPFHLGTSTTAVGCYSENAQPVSQMGQGAMVVGSQNATTFKGYGTAISNAGGWTHIGTHGRGLMVDGDFWVNNSGGDPQFWVDGSELNVNEPSGAYSSTVRFKSAGVDKGYILCTPGGDYHIRSNNSGSIEVGTDAVAYWWSPAFGISPGKRFEMNGSIVIDASRNATMASYNTESGGVYKVNGTQVVGAQGAAVSADATDLASALTLVNELKSRLRTHGLIA